MLPESIRREIFLPESVRDEIVHRFEAPSLDAGGHGSVAAGPDGNGRQAAAAGGNGHDACRGIELVRHFLATSPFAGHLGMELEVIEPDVARLAMPFRAPLATVGDLVHGGAISSLVDTAATAAAWSIADVPESPRGSTVGMSVDFVAPARGETLTASARVLRRGRSLCFCDVDVADAAGALVARGLVTYKLG